VSTTPDKAVTDKAVTVGVENLRDWLLTVDIGLDEFERLGPLSATDVVRGVLSAALPYLHQTEDTQTAELRKQVERLTRELAGMSDMAVRARDHNARMTAALHTAICNAVGWDVNAAWPGNQAAAEALSELRAAALAPSTGDQSEPTTPARQT
jgi:hypothetical protein